MAVSPQQKQPAVDPKVRQARIRKAYHEAQLLQKAGELDKAISWYHRILQVAPINPDAMVMLASIAYLQGRDEDARSHLDKVISNMTRVVERAPGNQNARMNLCIALLARDRCREAEAYLPGLNSPEAAPGSPQAEKQLERSRKAIDRNIPPIFLTTMPKSASESILDKLMSGLELARTKATVGLFPDYTLIPARMRTMARSRHCGKEHVFATPFHLKVFADEGIDRIVCHMRDPRQTTLSYIHFANDNITLQPLAPLWRKIMPATALIQQGLSAEIDWCIDNFLPRLCELVAGWEQVNADPDQPMKVLFKTFESYREDPDGYIRDVLDFYEIDHGLFEFEAESRVIHLRKGQTDEWRSVYTPEQQEKAWSKIPKDMAERYGWVR